MEPIRIVIVDDHHLFIDALSVYIEDARDLHVAGTASRVAEGLQVVRALRPDVVLMDHRLPDGSGIAAAAVIHEDLPATKVVMVTQFMDENLVLQALEAGVAAYVTKNKTGDELLWAIRAAAAGEASLPPDVLARVLPRLRKTSGPSRTLTRREKEILQLLADGRAVKQIAKALSLRPSTVRNHVQSTLSKLGAHSQLEAVALAARAGIVRVD